MTTKYNLTTRKKTLPDRIIGTFIKETKGKKVSYKPRFSKAYQPKSHSYNPAFKVLISGYWYKYGILTEADISAYNTLQFLCETEEPFSMEGLAEKAGIGKNTLRRRYDNLINAELLEIVTISDAPGKPNYYILRTPLFERPKSDDDMSEFRKKLRENNEDYPTTFLEDEAERLKRQVRRNRLGRLRKLVSKKRKLKGEGKILSPFRQALLSKLSGLFSNRKLILHRVFKTLRTPLLTPEGEIQQYSYATAMEFENTVWNVTRTMPEYDGTYYWEEFKKRLKTDLESKRIKYTPYLFDLAQKLWEFYDDRQVKQAGSAARYANDAPPEPPPSNEPGQVFNEEESEHDPHSEESLRELARTTLRNEMAKRRGINALPRTPAEFQNTIKQLGIGIYLDDEEIKYIASEFFTDDAWMKLTVEQKE